MEAPAVPPLAPQQQQHQHAQRHQHAHSHSVGSVGPPPPPPPPPGPFASGSAPSSAAIVPVRLPPVSLPPADFLEAPGFNPGRRQSVNSDPFLHAFSGAHHPHPPSHLNESFSPALAPDHARRDDLPPVPQPGAMPLEVLRAPSPSRDHHHGMHDARYPPPPGSAGPAHDGFEYGAQPYDEQQQQQHPGLSYEPGPVVPAAGYRFGGPSQGPNAPQPPPPPPDGTSYHDYPMSRPPLSHRGSGQSSPGRSSLPHPPQPPRPLDHPPRHSPTPSLKRKTSDESAAHEEGYGSYPANSPYLRGPPSAGAPPHPKRRTSTLTYEKLNGLSLAEQQRRDSSFGPISPWEEDRRGSDESYGSHSSHGYSVPAYHNVHPSVQGYELRVPPPSSAPPPHHAMQHGPPFDAQQVGPRGSIARGMYGDEPSSFARRPSIPSVSQMMQGQQPFYPVGAGAPPPPHSSHPGPPPAWPPPPPHSRPPPHPSLTISSEPPTPVNELDDPNSRPPTSSSYPPPPQQQPHQPHTSGPPPGPPAPWARGGPPVPPPGLAVSRHNSSGSVGLDPSSAYAPGQGPPSKETPYSRSPELRVSHKLAERKRRKEMAQLFEDLREQLPFDRGLKASKWEILSKANEYVASLKAFTEELINDNRALREHFNLPPGPSAPPPDVPEAHDEALRGPVDSSQDSSQVGGTSHEASPAPAVGNPAAGVDFAAPHPGGNNMTPSHSQQSFAAMQQQQQGPPGSMPQHQWQQQPQRPSSRSSFAGQVSPALGTASLKQQQQQRIVSGPPQPSPTLSQHSAPMSPPLGRGLSSTAGGEHRSIVSDSLQGGDR
ncbi:hypothetical protein JCM8208_001053 [Rhodotorula glutinis]